MHGFAWLKDAPDPDAVDWNKLRDPQQEIRDDEQEKMDTFVRFWDARITAVNPHMKDATDNTHFMGEHPCNTDHADCEDTREELAKMLNRVQRHATCRPGYCQVLRRVPGQAEKQQVCRFDYPLKCTDHARVRFDSKRRPRFEPRRNDSNLNAYTPATSLGWRANIDIKPLLSEEAAIKYISTQLNIEWLLTLSFSYISRYGSKAE